MRSRARNFARVNKWPEENATSLDVAKLATYRLLWLHRQTRRAVRGRDRDAAVLLARSSVETCILGFYCLHQADAGLQGEDEDHHGGRVRGSAGGFDGQAQAAGRGQAGDGDRPGLFVLADRRLTLEEFEPREATMRLYRGDELVSDGDGAACLGDPLSALGWLARTAREFGEPLRTGQIILSGALGPMVPAPPGSRFCAEIRPLGEVTATFCEEENS